MNLTPARRSEVTDPFRLIQREMNQIMQRFLGDSNGSGNGEGQSNLVAWVPRVDIEEDEKGYLVKADLPGIDPKDVEISVIENTLVVRGRTQKQREEKKKEYHRIERVEGEFYRELVLPQGIDAEHIEATAEHGVLMIRLPKKAEAQPKKISVQAKDQSAQSVQQTAQPAQQAGQSNPQGQAGQQADKQTAA
jgi:HSP20 family protein